MRGAEPAARHMLEFVRRGLLARPELTRGLAGDVAEGACERSEAGPARLEGDLGNGELGVAEQRRRLLDAPGEQIAMRGNAERFLEGAREVRLGDVAHACQPSDGPLLVRGGVHPVLRAQQAAQQRGVLACTPSSLLAPEPRSHERPIRCPRRGS